MKVFVYYNDGYCEMGDHGIEGFENREAAAEFIAARIRSDAGRELANYQVIEGKELALSPISIVRGVLIS